MASSRAPRKSATQRSELFGMHPNYGEDRTLFTPIKASTSISESETDLICV